MADLEDLLRDLNGELSAARDTLEHYDRKRKEFESRFDKQFPDYRQVRECCWKWREQVQNLVGYVERTRRTMISREPQPQPQPAKEEVQVKPSSSFQGNGGANERHLADALRKARTWRVGIPLPPSYGKSPSSFTHQALSRAIINHAGYEAQVAAGAILDLTDNTVSSRTKADLRQAAEVLGLDADAVMQEARDVFLDITTYGKSGEHYQW